MLRGIRKVAVVSAPRDEVWAAWTTPEAARTFFAPAAHIELALGGAYELLFDLEAPPGAQGSEGMRVLSYLPPEMLSFEWNAPPQFPTVRNGPRTWVVVRLDEYGSHATWLWLSHLGWREGEEWSAAFDYFARAWDTVLGRLRQRFVSGPVDWDDPYRPTQSFDVPAE